MKLHLKCGKKYSVTSESIKNQVLGSNWISLKEIYYHRRKHFNMKIDILPIFQIIKCKVFKFKKAYNRAGHNNQYRNYEFYNSLQYLMR